MSKVILQVDDVHERNPCFETRLEKTFIRVHKIISHRRIKRLYWILAVCGVAIYFVSKPEAKDLFEPLITVLGSCLVGYIGLIISVYWSIDGVFGRRWTLIFEKFYQINRIKDEDWRNFHFCNMWQDAITMGVWADEALNKPLYDHLVAALQVIKNDRESLTIKLHSHTLTKEDAVWLLGQYADLIKDKKKQSTGGSANPPANPTQPSPSSPPNAVYENAPDDDAVNIAPPPLVDKVS
jgi:hypothetical protein